MLQRKIGQHKQFRTLANAQTNPNGSMGEDAMK